MRPVLFIISCFFLLQSCQENGESRSHVFHYNLPNNITSLDPAFAKNRNNIWAVDHLYSTLVQYDDHMNIIPDIARSWDISEDGLTYTFTLREDIYFHPSPIFEEPRRLVAQDVAYSLGRLLDPEVNSPGSWVLSGEVRENNPFQILDDTTFILHLEKPFPPMLGILTMQYCSVIPKEAVDAYGDEFRKMAVGTGPMRLVKWEENQGLFLERYQDYHHDISSNIEGVRVSFINDRKTSLLELLSGGLDFQSGLDPAYKAILFDKHGEIQSRHNDRVILHKSPYLNTEYLGINLVLAERNDHPLSDKNFRKALNFGLNKHRMMSSLRSGFGSPADHGFVPKGMKAFNPNQTGYVYNPDSARVYLKKSGYDGTPLVLYTNGDYLDICLYAMKQWQEMGINGRVELLESSLLRERMRKGEIMFFRASWIGDYPDDETFLTVFYGKNPAPPNYTRFADSEFDELYREAMATEVVPERIEMYQKMNGMIIREAPVVFLFYDETVLLTSPDVKGLSLNAFNLLRLDSLTLSR